ncbi:hypothetical protein [Metakosakonia massiliensis]|uniref:DUF5951 family protein n=1 Tax=Phytobacter massiliensis TaxID=1485952 RepID=UPI0012E6FF62
MEANLSGEKFFVKPDLPFRLATGGNHSNLPGIKTILRKCFAGSQILTHHLK